MHCARGQPQQQLISFISVSFMSCCDVCPAVTMLPPSVPLGGSWRWVCCMVTGTYPSSASPSTWRSRAHRLPPCRWDVGCPAQCLRSKSRWNQTTTRTTTTTGRGTWVAKPRCNVLALVWCAGAQRCHSWPRDSTRWWTPWRTDAWDGTERVDSVLQHLILGRSFFV